MTQSRTWLSKEKAIIYAKALGHESAGEVESLCNG